MRALAVLFGLLAASELAAADCGTQRYEGLDYTVCTVDPARDDLRLFLNGPDGAPLGSFAAIEAAHPGQRLAFAMNAGMYHEDRAPVGHFVEGGRELMRLLTAASPGNFGLLPNGVFCIAAGTARVYETLDFAARAPACRDATQSGPMLVIDGALHPRFLPDSTSRHIRNGVGTTNAGDRAVFVISDQPVTFHQFARFFRDALGLPQALYFDGRVSRLYAPALGRADGGVRMGPMVGVLEPG
ncbi:MAG: hypothetical protein GW886_10135 [Rhodobacterales bacterium]|nr:hypothetical protein [Rhodobacterales bacterium]NCT11415.1 hypothetical protein [Rhodobacterales bacterium]